MNELKNLEACGMTTMGTALKQVNIKINQYISLSGVVPMNK